MKIKEEEGEAAGLGCGWAVLRREDGSSPPAGRALPHPDGVAVVAGTYSRNFLHKCTF